jgi:hypothetical protein
LGREKIKAHEKVNHSQAVSASADKMLKSPYIMGSKDFLLAPQMGHFQSSGRSAKAVPLGILPFLSPFSEL